MAKTIEVTIIDPVGLHARPASLLVAEAAKFSSDLTLHANGQKANLKSIMNIMALAVKAGTKIKIEASGKDEEAAIKALETVMKNNKIV